jgi:magnesium transporter
MKFRLPHPSRVATTLRELARRRPDEAEEYLDTHQAEWEHLAESDPHNAADILEALAEEGAADLLTDLSVDDAGDVLDEMVPQAAADVLEELRPAEAAALVAEMEPDQAADVIGALEPEERTAVLAALDPETALEVENLLIYEADTAGGMMTTDVASLPAGMTAGEAIETLRKLYEALGSILSYVYVTDDAGRLVGVVSFRELVFARPSQGLDEAMMSDPVTVTPATDRAEVAELIHRYHLLAIPVVDDRQHLVGIVKFGEAIEAIQAEAGEDLAVMFGAGDEESVFTPVLRSVRFRLPWNMFNLLAGFVTVFVIARFEGTLASYAILAAFMPLVAGLSGNSGAQAVAVTIRSIAVGQLPPGREMRAVRRELGIGLVRGVIIATMGALLAAAAVVLLDPSASGNVSPARMAGIIFISMMVGFVTAAIAGSSIPLILRRLGLDPAMASNIFLTMITDAVGFGVFLLTATLLL